MDVFNGELLGQWGRVRVQQLKHSWELRATQLEEANPTGRDGVRAQFYLTGRFGLQVCVGAQISGVWLTLALELR